VLNSAISTPPLFSVVRTPSLNSPTNLKHQARTPLQSSSSQIFAQSLPLPSLLPFPSLPLPSPSLLTSHHPRGSFQPKTETPSANT
jgi:hypothetical protein